MNAYALFKWGFEKGFWKCAEAARILKYAFLKKEYSYEHVESFIKILTKIISIFSVRNKQDKIGFLDASTHLVLKVYFNCIFLQNHKENMWNNSELTWTELLEQSWKPINWKVEEIF